MRAEDTSFLGFKLCKINRLETEHKVGTLKPGNLA